MEGKYNRHRHLLVVSAGGGRRRRWPAIKQDDPEAMFDALFDLTGIIRQNQLDSVLVQQLLPTPANATSTDQLPLISVATPPSPLHSHISLQTSLRLLWLRSASPPPPPATIFDVLSL